MPAIAAPPPHSPPRRPWSAAPAAPPDRHAAAVVPADAPGRRSPPSPAAAAGSRVSRGRSTAARFSASTRSSRLSNTARSSGRGRRARASCLDRHARQIAAVQRGQVLRAVLQMVQHLQRRAQRIRRHVGRAILAVQIEHMAPDRHRRIAAVIVAARPSPHSAAWSRRGGTRSADRANGAASRRFRPGWRADAARSASRRRAGRAARPPSRRAARSSRPPPGPANPRCRRHCARTRRRRARARAGRGGSAASRPESSRRRDPCRTTPRRSAAPLMRRHPDRRGPSTRRRGRDGG